MKLSLSPFAALLVLALAVGACGDDAPTGNNNNNNLDPTLPTNPCDSGFSANVGPNGFIMSGSGYQGQIVRFTDFSRYLTFEEYGEPGNENAAITFTIRDTVALPDDPNASMTFDIHLPSFRPNVYEFNNLVGDSAAYVRIALRRTGIGDKVYRSTEGRFVLDSLVDGARAYGTFCGMLKDSVSRSQIAIMNGRFAASE